ncbi:LANO_0C05534g1_1 [Lachancea nothofagi CBS 11611]|uniref:glutathione-specific gamma-glutamylcyclotransferase n=1 Tax=Lachancea nothofagi CBS 11611 TaxID=1266666 RepID=A0A1G4J7H5_9SACH|nr:LANO_0C05534g1_1 [Lachancea nothofagi CBS 11611]
MTQDQGIWVLGYGSLIYNPPQHYQYRVPGIIYGYKRRFWQSSSDHRGTPENPGRVATLIPYESIVEKPEYLHNVTTYRSQQPKCPEDLQVLSMAYYIPAERAQQVLQFLDVREQDGYTQRNVEVHLETDGVKDEGLITALAQLPTHPRTQKPILRTLVYIGVVGNDSFVGLEPIEHTAKVIRCSRGLSGHNNEYLANLYAALLDIAQSLSLPLEQLEDTYLRELVRLVQRDPAVFETSLQSTRI